MLVVAVILMLIGLIGIFIPGLPGNGLIFLAALGYGIITKFEKISIFMILVFAGLTILAIIFDYVGSLLGAKKFGATKPGLVGGALGAVLGFFTVGIPGLLIGQFAGTLIGEIYSGKKLSESSRIGLGGLLGYVFAVVINTTLGMTIIVLFLLKVL